MDENLIECTKCYWQGDPSELVCSEEDADKPVEECKFNVCPNCGSVDQFEDCDFEDES